MKPAQLIFLILAVCLSGCGSRASEPAYEQSPAGTDASTEQPRVEHRDFDLNTNDLESLISPTEPEARQRIRENTTRFLDLLAAVLRSPDELFLNVDRIRRLPSTYEPDDLVELDLHAADIDLNKEGHRLREVALGPLKEMVRAARAEGITLLVSSVYRSYDYQRTVFDYWVNELGPEQAERTSARPGASQHQLGTTIDFGCICEAFAQTEAGQWLAQNAYRFGFSMSYPEGLEYLTGYVFESWHYRFIGAEAAALEREFFGGIQHHLLAYLDEIRPLAAPLLKPHSIREATRDS